MKKQNIDDLKSARRLFGLTLLQLMSLLGVIGIIVALIVHYWF